METKLTINGTEQRLDLDPRTTLLDALRHHLGLTGSKKGCDHGQCGACTVELNGMTRRSCVTPLSMVEGSYVTTIEGVDGPEAKAVQAAWEAIDVPQCGWCQSGQVMSATALLREIPNPTDEDIDNAMAGNICRCATYVRIREAIKNAAKELEG